MCPTGAHPLFFFSTSAMKPKKDRLKPSKRRLKVLFIRKNPLYPKKMEIRDKTPKLSVYPTPNTDYQPLTSHISANYPQLSYTQGEVHEVRATR